ncbi:hypothetical protein THL1_2999 [Pseudomonas sp. TCU-HL1]|nr:hypothetical protein THL1_2987 [Pseudomonas sp. TCU-HL1]AOE85547.1 hypothetical protein THL1_2999 [Pseudomonas sp. TCU-HL1]
MNPKPDPDVLAAKMRRRLERAFPVDRDGGGSDRPGRFGQALLLLAIGFALGYWWASH